MILLYDTGARVQEMLNIRLSDIQLGPLPKVTLFGKGRKTRIVPLMEKTAQHLKKYLLEFHADNASEEDVTLFYSVIRGEKHPLTSRTVQYILQKYGEQARQVCKEIPPNVHPHLFRHSRAMHIHSWRPLKFMLMQIRSISVERSKRLHRRIIRFILS